MVDSFRTWTKNWQDFSGCTLRHAIRDEKSIYDSKKEKSLANTHKLRKNSKTYLDVQNEFAPKLKLSWVVSDPTRT